MLNAKSERRVSRRVFADEEAVLLFDERHQNAKLRDLSASGARLVTPVRPEIGKEVIFYADAFGRFDGKVARHAPFGVGIEIIADAKQAQRIMERLRTYGGSVQQSGSLPQGLDARRILMETLALSGRIAGSRATWSETFWEVAMQCRSRGWIVTSPINAEFDMIELTAKGRRTIGV